ncbi:MAG: hypothetical protein FJ104_16165 [Deltaproteobacteria bacterium]|nr:hypothetical protein [Deltaproteobacteria bacterium]
MVPARPVVTDSGEVIAAVPTGETTYAEAPPPPPAPAEAAPAAEVAMDMDEMASSAAPSRSMKKSYRGEMNAPAGGGLGGGGEGQGYGFGSGHGRLGGAAAPAARPAPSMAPRNVSALAAVALEGGTTRYALPSRVNVPDESATMVLLLHQGVPGSAVHLFAPDPGVPDSSSHPFRVVRFTNATPGMLERGPIAVFEKGSFLGEGMLDPLPPKATATVPFALERGLAIQSESRYQELGARVALIQASELTIERDQVHETRYRVQNGGADATRLLVKHPRMHGARLHSPPAGTEDNLATMSALVPVDVAAYGKAELLVDERTPVRHPEDWLSDAADLAVKAYLADARSDAKVVSQLGAAWVVRDKLRDRHDARARLATEQSELERSTHETRLALKSLEKNTRAADLVSKLTDRLRKATDRLDQITKEVIEVDLALRELEVRFRDAIREIALGPQDPGGGR